jgi:integrase
MVTHPKRQLTLLKERIENSDSLSEDDRKALLEFSDRLNLLRSEYSVQRHEKLLRHCTIAAEEVGGLTDSLEEKSVAESILLWINEKYDNEETNKDYRLAIRMFGKRLAESRDGIETNDDGIPESLSWIPTTTSRNYDPSPDPGKMLDWEDDVVPMIDATLNARDAALIAVAWDAGPRSGELLDLRYGDVSDHKHGLQISVDGKKGQRSIMLITAVPHLNRWLQDHPKKGDPMAHLWCHLQTGEELSYPMLRKVLRKAAQRAGVTKPVTFTNFRKSSASYLASQGVNQAVLEDHHGWTRGSKAAARYISVFAEASDREIARAHGVDVTEEEPNPIAAITCPRCKEKTLRDEPFCMWCHQALGHEAVDEMETSQQQQRRVLLGFAKENPKLLDRLEEMEPFIETLGGDPEIIRAARQFADAASEQS